MLFSQTFPKRRAGYGNRPPVKGDLFICIMTAILSYINTKSNGIAHAVCKKAVDAGNGPAAAHTE